MAIPTTTIDVEDANGLAAVDAALGGVADFAVDVEADAMHAFPPRMCFVQIGTDRDVWLLDTLGAGGPGVPISALKAHFEAPQRRKYFHAADGGDLKYLAEAGVRVQGLFDTYVAASFLGWQKLGLSDLVLEHLGVTLTKKHQRSDFALRPLPPAMREYIADDVRYLVDLGRLVRERCRDKDILEEVELECARLAAEARAPDLLRDFSPKLERHGKGADEIQLAKAISLALHKLRLTLATGANVPFGLILSNRELGAIAHAPPLIAKDLEPLASRAFARRHGEAVLMLVREQQRRQRDGELPAEPPREKRREHERRQREEALMKFRKEAAAVRNITPMAVLPNRVLSELVNLAPASLESLSGIDWLGQKRVRLYGEGLIEALNLS